MASSFHSARSITLAASCLVCALLTSLIGLALTKASSRSLSQATSAECGGTSDPDEKAPSLAMDAPAGVLVVTLDGTGEAVCGVSESAMPAEPASWPLECRSIRLSCAFGGMKGLTPDEFRSVAKLACRNCSLASGLTISLVDRPEDAEIHLAASALRGSILAWCEFPSSCSRAVQTRFNSSVSWSEPLFLDTLVHELGHGFGLPHTSDRRDIMFPSIVAGRAIDGLYGPHFSGPQMVTRYGPHRPNSPIPDFFGAIRRGVTLILAFLAGLLTGAAVGGFFYWNLRRGV